MDGAELTLTAHRLHYDAALFERASAERMARHLRRVLDLVTADPRLPVAEVGLVTDQEQARILGEFNATARPYPRDATIHGLFRERARSAPDRVAVVAGGSRLTYRELDVRSDGLARRLRAAGVVTGAPVGLLLPRSAELVVATLAILKAGGGYLPIDPGYPAQRTGFLLADSGAQVLVTNAEPPHGFSGTVVHPAEWCASKYHHYGQNGPLTAPIDGSPVPATATDLAYVIYTSGTTGRPKGVRVAHRSVVRLVRGADYVELTEDTRLLATCSPVFDVATFELWGPLLAGGTLHLVPDDVILDATALGAAIAEHAVNTMWLTAPLFNQLVEQDATIFGPLRTLLVGGDALSPRHVGAVLAACPGVTLVNGYGPTENTTFSTTHVVTVADLERIPIGRPIANSTAYVLDRDGLLCPVGVPGDLALGGDGVALGYLDRPELTERRFVPDPFAPGRTMYRSGDVARWRPDGVLEFFGRRDDQVKVRGFRIELGEIENTLLEHPAVREAVVLAPHRDGGERSLCGYYVPGRAVTAHELREHLGRRLPAHMVPRHLVELPAMPLNASGKVDRTALPEPDAPDAEYVPPRDDLEGTLLRLAKRALRVPGIGVRHDLRDLGADSLTGSLLAAGIRAELGVRLPVASVLRGGTVEAIADAVRGLRLRDRHKSTYGGPAGLGTRHESTYGGAGEGIPRAPELASYPLTPQQHRVYVEQCKDETAVHYNVPVSVELPADTDVDRLLAALAEVTARHDALRTEFVLDGPSVRQRIRPVVELPVVVTDEPLRVRPFDLGRAPLWRAAIHRNGERVRLAMDLHHTIVDGLSLAGLFEDLAASYAGTPPAEPPVRYRDYAHHIAGTTPRAEDREYWHAVFATPQPGNDLPLDFPRPPIRALDGATVEFVLDGQRTAALRQLAREHDTTLFAVLAAAYTALLARLTGHPDVTVGTPVSGRTEPGLDRTVGMFASTVCLRVRADPGLPFQEYLRAVARTVEDAVAHQDYPLQDLVPPRRDYARTPLFDALIALHSAHYLNVDWGAGAKSPLRLEFNGQAVFDLNLQLYETADGLRASWQYASRLLRRDTVEQWRDALIELLDAVLAAPRVPVGELTGATRAPVPDLEFDL